MAWVEASAGALDWKETGSSVEDDSTLPLFTKTLAWVAGKVTRGGWTPIFPDCDVGGSGSGGAAGAVAAGLGISPVSSETPIEEAVADFCGKSGVVLAPAGAPVMGGAEGFGGIDCEGGRVTLGIGLVTAVDQLGVVPVAGAGSSELEVFKGKVVAAEMFGRAAGAILVDAGLSGRGGKLIRKVSRFGAFGSDPGVGVSAIIFSFYSYFGKSSMAKFAIVTYLCT